MEMDVGAAGDVVGARRPRGPGAGPLASQQSPVTIESRWPRAQRMGRDPVRPPPCGMTAERSTRGVGSRRLIAVSWEVVGSTQTVPACSTHALLVLLIALAIAGCGTSAQTASSTGSVVHGAAQDTSASFVGNLDSYTMFDPGSLQAVESQLEHIVGNDTVAAMQRGGLRISNAPVINCSETSPNQYQCRIPELANKTVAAVSVDPNTGAVTSKNIVSSSTGSSGTSGATGHTSQAGAGTTTGTGATSSPATSSTAPSLAPVPAAQDCGTMPDPQSHASVVVTVESGVVACSVVRAMLADRFAGKAGPLQNTQQGLAFAYEVVDGWRCGFGTGGGGGCSRGHVQIAYQLAGSG
jgi:hypothetical protein